MFNFCVSKRNLKCDKGKVIARSMHLSSRSKLNICYHNSVVSLLPREKHFPDLIYKCTLQIKNFGFEKKVCVQIVTDF